MHQADGSDAGRRWTCRSPGTGSPAGMDRVRVRVRPEGRLVLGRLPRFDVKDNAKVVKAGCQGRLAFASVLAYSS
jgi:hypothetical protein